MKNLKILVAFLIILISCTKEPGLNDPGPSVVTEVFTEYSIPAGGHYCDQTMIRPVSIIQMGFKVKFDSSAIYSTLDPQNQYDINKLYGFTEGQDPHRNSARFGWSYNDQALRLYAYVYNNGQRISQEITTVNIGESLTCWIRPENDSYIFIAGNKQVKISRTATGSPAQGYQLFPYFGGDETAPHPVRIFIREL